jgi:hypothetical protein
VRTGSAVRAGHRRTGHRRTGHRPTGHLPTGHLGPPEPAPRSGVRCRALLVPGLALLALVAWLVGLHPLRPEQLGGYGIITHLSPLILISYPLLVGAAVAELMRPQRRTWLMTLLTGQALVMIYGLQPATESAARLPVAWLHAGFADQIGNNGHVLQNFDTRFSWPGFFALVAFIGKAAGYRDVSPMLAWAPVVLTGLATLGVRAMATAVFGDRRIAWIATWVFLLGNWTEQDYFSPQGSSFVLLVAALAVTLRYLVRPGLLEGGRVRWSDRPVPTATPGERLFAQAVVLLLATALAPTHQLSPFMLVGVLMVLVLWGRLRPGWLPVMAFLPAAAWFVLGAKEFWKGQLGLVTGSIGNVNSSVSQGVGNRVAGDTGHELMVLSRIGLTGLVGLLTLGGFLVLRRRGTRTWVLPALICCSFVLAVLQPYGGEIFMRCYLFALPWMAIGSAVFLEAVFLEAVFLDAVRWPGRPRFAGGALAAGLSVIALTTVMVRGGNDAYTSITTADLHAVRYVYAHARPGQSLIAPLWYEPLRAGRVDNLVQVSTSELATVANPCLTSAQIEQCLFTARPDYIVVNPQQEAAGELLQGLPVGWLNRIEADLLQRHGYRVVFRESGARVLARIATTGA